MLGLSGKLELLEKLQNGSHINLSGFNSAYRLGFLEGQLRQRVSKPSLADCLRQSDTWIALLLGIGIGFVATSVFLHR